MVLEMQSVDISKAVQLHLDDPQKKRSQPVHPGASNQSFLDLRMKLWLCCIESPVLMMSPSYPQPLTVPVHSSGSTLNPGGTGNAMTGADLLWA